MKVAARFCILFLVIGLVSAIPPWQRPGIPKPPPSGFGVAVGYHLGRVSEVDSLGAVWYVDYDYQSVPLGNHRRLYMVSGSDDLQALASMARAHPGEWWQFGNEPNDPNQDNLSPSEYARRYHRFYYLLKSADSSAQIVPAGVADADWKWANAFREAYRKQFGSYPQVDGWNIHNYLLKDCKQALDLDTFQSRIISFHEWVKRIDEFGKPLFLTEFGVLYGNGCCNCPLIPSGHVLDFMRLSTEWLNETNYVQGWAWFALRTGGRYNGDLSSEDGSLTEFGETYRELMRASVRAGQGARGSRPK